MAQLIRKNIIDRTVKIRQENGKTVKYFVTDDAYEDDYGSWVFDYHAWREEDGVVKCLTNGCVRYSQSDAEAAITFGKWQNCPTCNHRHFVHEEDLPKQKPKKKESWQAKRDKEGTYNK